MAINVNSSLEIGSDNLVTLVGLIDVVTSAYQDAATVTGYVIDVGSDSIVTSSSFTLAYVAASNGNYRGTITAVVSSTLVLWTEYIVQITASSGGFTKVFRAPCTAQYPDGG